ncbi:DUF3014 domain-containing protein [Ramlibacter sp. G-1-2-2]|uniref:DUF3014 domain-containing protein n=1 Tax=Ramlibacter agri TaxID=2728837 RepID=A0A848H388_9BURK|nr:DUF3014 domain-containing protein [Ramlibacter agri]
MRPPRRASRWPLVLLVLALAAGGWLWFYGVRLPDFLGGQDKSAPVVLDTGERSAPEREVHPPPTDEPPRVAQGDEVETALADALGREAVLRFLQVGGFQRRLVATLDNLGREHAPVAAWPVLATPGRFAVEGQAGSEHIAAANAARYAPFVDFATSVRATTVVDLYRRLYPVLQQSYIELGFGGRSFHERVIAVVDLLLATPEPQQAPAVELTAVHGPIPSVQPWTRYAFADPRLQALPAGQKMLLRLDADQRLRVKARLREIRTLLVQPPPAR